MKTLRVAISGSGMRSRSVWQRHVRESSGLELVGVQDPSEDSRAHALESGAVTPAEVFEDLGEMLAQTQPDVVIVASVNAAHAAGAETALRAGCDVLVEKPLATTLVDACRIVRTAEELGRVVGVVQNWRAKTVGRRLRQALEERMIGDPSHIFFRYLRDRELPHLPDYLFTEDDPLLFAMAIHHFDLFRSILGQEFSLVDARSARPAWSRYRNPSILQAWLETENGIVVSYAATFSSRNAFLPLESLQVEGKLGTLHNESTYSEPPLLLSLRGTEEPIDLTEDEAVRDVEGQYDLADRSILENFRRAVVDGEPLIAPGRDNLGTIATVAAVALSSRDGRDVDPRALLAEADAMESHA
jgi:predicted dehydrogenase